MINLNLGVICLSKHDSTWYQSVAEHIIMNYGSFKTSSNHVSTFSLKLHPPLTIKTKREIPRKALFLLAEVTSMMEVKLFSSGLLAL
ncbi:hypothetical protein DY000_02046208 [Brassica cretica]|uniref:Uncharacterized protein n=2 Tax=Brassica TaxID=3705 RepID=A0ABQ7F3W0_BRACR|nr:hypothetical protein DY000_02046208 [Brassica cretica]